MILWRSGLKSPALGKGFRAHPGTATLGSFDAPVDMTFGATQGMASTHFRNEPGLKLETLNMPLELIAGRLSGAGTTLMQRVRENTVILPFGWQLYVLKVWGLYVLVSVENPRCFTR